MNIATIVDKIIKEADIQANEYTVADRLVDIHQTRLELETIKRQSGSFVQKEVAQTETIVNGDQSFTKTFNHAEIVKIEYRATGGSEQDYYCLDKRRDCTGSGCHSYLGAVRYTEDRNTVYLWEAVAGELRITYADDRITEWVEADYTTGTVAPDELEEVYHPLLWLKQVQRHTGFYHKERYQQFMIELDRLEALFFEEVGRDRDNFFVMRSSDSRKNNV